MNRDAFRLVLHKCLHFCWLVLHKCLPTNAFRDCPDSTSIWDALLFSSPSSYSTIEFANWFTIHATSSNGVLFMVFESSHLQKPLCHVSWVTPLGNTIKVNVDGNSLNNPGRADFGGIMRNSRGNWLLGFSGFIGIATSLQAELHAIYN
ncbi:ribonuclease H, partial [Trifolium pratense]